MNARRVPIKWIAGCGLVLLVVLSACVLLRIHESHSPQVSRESTSTPKLLASPEGSELASTSQASISTTSVASTSNSGDTTNSDTSNQSGTANAAADVSAARDLDSSSALLLSSIVNIVCLSADSQIPSVSASGVMIDPRGIIVTAAHVAQMFLLEDYLGTSKVECIIRDGSPARRAYLAEPIYVSKTWIENNPDTLTSKSPQGTGENDVALLGITQTATSTPLPSSYAYMPLSDTDPQVGEKVTIGSYGAQYLDSTEINYDLYPILTFGSIADRYTFKSDTVDLISVNGTAASQEGSSGGGIANAMSQLIGIITTSTTAGDFQDRSLNAVTVEHLRATYTLDTGQHLDSTLQSESVPDLISGFSNESKILGSKLYSDIVSDSQ